MVHKRLRIADFDIKAHFEERLRAFIREYSERAHPVRWKESSFDKILPKCEQAILKAA